MALLHLMLIRIYLCFDLKDNAYQKYATFSCSLQQGEE